MGAGKKSYMEAQEQDTYNILVILKLSKTYFQNAIIWKGIAFQVRVLEVLDM